MRHRLLRAFVTLTTLAVVWLVASPARASVSPSAPNAAPLCDPRGAVVFAPPPQMQDLEVSLDVVDAEDCAATSPARTHHATRHRAPAPIETTASHESANRASPSLAAPRADSERLPAPAASTTCSRPGYRSTVDRPPRA